VAIPEDFPPLDVLSTSREETTDTAIRLDV
jgi:hypothetical protein